MVDKTAYQQLQSIRSAPRLVMRPEGNDDDTLDKQTPAKIQNQNLLAVSQLYEPPGHCCTPMSFIYFVTTFSFPQNVGCKVVSSLQDMVRCATWY